MATAEEWANEMFECELCLVCGKDKENHDIIALGGKGNWFARCKNDGEDER